MLAALLVIATLVVDACSSGVGYAAPSTTHKLDPLMDFTGLWTGTSTSSANAAKVRITFNVERQGNHLKGTYRCAPLNAPCRNNIHQGWLRGSIGALSFTVSMEDTSWCAFRLQHFNLQVGDGEYTCYMNASLVDTGVFQIRRSAATPPPSGKG
jgi:hypothetical protein